MTEVDTLKVGAEYQEVSKATKAVLVLGDTLKILRGEMIQVGDKSVALGNGFTKTQAKMLAMLKVSGATTEELRQMSKTLQQMNNITGVNPFDKSASALEFIKKQREELEKSIKYSTQYNNLTKEQIALLTRGIEATRQKATSEGKSFGQREVAVKSFISQFIKEADALNAVNRQVQENNRLAKEQIAMQKQQEANAQRQKDLLAQHEANLKAQAVAREAAIAKEVDAWRKAEEAKVKASKEAAAKIEAAEEAKLAAMRKATWREYGQNVGKVSPESASMSKYYQEMIDTQKKVVEQDKKTTSEMFTNRMHFINQEIDSMKARSKMWNQLYGADHAQSLRDEAAAAKELAAQNKLVAQSEMQRAKAAAQVGPDRSLYEKAQRQAAKATDYLTQAESRLAAALDETNNGLHERYTDRLNKYQQALKASGMTAQDAAARFQTFKQGLEQVQSKEQTNRLNNLSRALSVQMGDVGVSLAGGMNPLMVMIQQGDQIRAAIQQAGASGEELRKAMTNAAGQIAKSFIDTGYAIGSFFVGSIVSAGKTITDFLINPIKLAMIASSNFFSAGKKDIEGYNRAMEAAKDSMIAFGKLGVLTLVAALSVLLVEIYKVTAATDQLNLSLNSSGARLGMSTSQAVEFARTVSEKYGYSFMSAIKTVNSFAKSGIAVNEEMLASALRYSKITGKSIDDVVAKYKDLESDPAKSLAKIAEGNGLISIETIKQIKLLEDQKKYAEASKLAQLELNKVLQQEATNTYTQMSPLGKLFIKIKEDLSLATDEVTRFANSSGSIDVLSNSWKALATSIAAVWHFTKLAGDTIGAFAAQAVALANFEALANFDLSGAIFIGKEWQKNSKDAMNSWVDIKNSIWDTAKAAQQAGKIETDAQTSKANAAANYLKTQNDLKQAAREAEAEAKKIKKFGEDSIQQATNAYLKQIGAVQQLTDAQVQLNQVMANDMWKKLPKDVQETIKSFYDAAGANEILKKAEMDRASQLDFIASLTGKADKMGAEYYSGIKKLDEAFVDGNISLSQYIDLLNELYKVSSSFKSLQGIESSVTKNIESINAQRQSIKDKYSMDFKSDDQKAQLQAESNLRKEIALADAEFNKNISDAKNKLNDADLEAATKKYREEANVKKALAQETYDRETSLLTEAYKRQQAYKNAFDNLFSGMADAIVEFAKTGKLNFKGLIDSMLQDILRFEMKKNFMNMYEGMGGAAGIFKSITSMFGFANGGAFDGGIQAFAKGGTFTNTVVDSPTLFKFAKGTGLMGEAGPEAIMPLKRGPDGSLGVQAISTGSNVSVSIINNTNATATASETVDSKGNRKVEVVIGEMTAGEISRSGSASQKSIRSTFGIQPQLIRR